MAFHQLCFYHLSNVYIFQQECDVTTRLQSKLICAVEPRFFVIGMNNSLLHVSLKPKFTKMKLFLSKFFRFFLSVITLINLLIHTGGITYLLVYAIKNGEGTGVIIVAIFGIVICAIFFTSYCISISLKILRGISELDCRKRLQIFKRTR